MSKAFAEGLSRFYDRYGIGTDVRLHVASPFPRAAQPPHTLATWMSYDDLERLVVSRITKAPVVGYSITHGMPGDDTTTWSLGATPWRATSATATEPSPRPVRASSRDRGG